MAQTKKRTASSRKGSSGPLLKWKRKWKRFRKKNEKVLDGVLGLALVCLLILLIAVPASRVSNPGNTYGIDVSSHNGSIRWKEVAENGVEFAVIRAGSRGYRDGVIKEDAQFKRNMHHAWFHHVDRGVYFYSQAVDETEAREEAEAVLKSINGASLALPVFLDLEDTGTGGKGRADGLTKAQRTQVALAFADVVRDKGYTPGVYANRWFLQNQLDTDALRDAGISIWLAEYTSRERPKFTGEYDYWQYSEKGTVPGIDTSVDLDRTSADVDNIEKTSGNS